MSGADHNDRIQRAVEIMRHALILEDDLSVWMGLAFVLERRLTRQECSMLLAALTRAAATEDALLVMERLAADVRVGPPLPILEDSASDARWWANLASDTELKAWLAACFARLPPNEQHAFLEAAIRKTAA